MAQEAQRVAERGGGGWPLGLQPLNGRVGGFVRNRELSGSISFSTLLTGSPSSSTVSSSDLDTESTGSFFHDRSITLGSLIGVTSILELSRRSSRMRTLDASRDRKNHRPSKPWFFSLCSKLSTDAVSINNAPSLGYFLKAERRAAISYRKNQMASQPSSLPLVTYDARKNQRAQDDNGYGVPLLLSCLRGQIIG